METSTRLKKILAVTNFPVRQSVVQYPTSLFYNSEGTLDILPNTLEIGRKIASFHVTGLVRGEGTNELRPP